MKFLGLIPLAYSSGERRWHGTITKARKMQARHGIVQTVIMSTSVDIDNSSAKPNPTPSRTLAGRRRYASVNA